MFPTSCLFRCFQLVDQPFQPRHQEHRLIRTWGESKWSQLNSRYFICLLKACVFFVRVLLHWALSVCSTSPVAENESWQDHVSTMSSCLVCFRIGTELEMRLEINYSRRRLLAVVSFCCDRPLVCELWKLWSLVQFRWSSCCRFDILSLFSVEPLIFQTGFARNNHVPTTRIGF